MHAVKDMGTCPAMRDGDHYLVVYPDGRQVKTPRGTGLSIWSDQDHDGEAVLKIVKNLCYIPENDRLTLVEMGHGTTGNGNQFRLYFIILTPPDPSGDYAVVDWLALNATMEGLKHAELGTDLH